MDALEGLQVHEHEGLGFVSQGQPCVTFRGASAVMGKSLQEKMWRGPANLQIALEARLTESTFRHGFLCGQHVLVARTTPKPTHCLVRLSISARQPSVEIFCSCKRGWKQQECTKKSLMDLLLLAAEQDPVKLILVVFAVVRILMFTCYHPC